MGPLHVLILFSICSRIRYQPHQILCNTVLNLYEEMRIIQQSQPDDPSLSAKVVILKRGLSLLDEAIGSSYCSQDESLPFIKLAPPIPYCSFCGGELFRTVFGCTELCVRDGAPDDSVNCKILICSQCFIDGRSCRCRSMTPYRIQPLEELIKLRTNAANLLGVSDEGSAAYS